jgi:hypothetical protein
MKKQLLILNILLTSLTLTNLAGCASTNAAQPSVERVKITKEAVSNNCILKGKVSTFNGLQSMRPDQHSALQDAEFNRLRNQASQLGANTVVLSPSSGMTNKKHWASKVEHKTTASHIFAGNAYWCPAN